MIRFWNTIECLAVAGMFAFVLLWSALLTWITFAAFFKLFE